jgi:hypothetical protein
VSTVPSIVEQPPVAEDPSARTSAYRHWPVVACYLLGALIVTGRLWVDRAGRMQAGDAQDVNPFAWFLRYSATAISHGRLPALFTTALNAPRGVNLTWNTAFLLPGVLLTPVTLLAGPQVSRTIVLAVSIAGSTVSLYFVLRRWGASVTVLAVMPAKAMRWQASAGEPGSMDDGYFSGPNSTGNPVFSLGPPQTVANCLTYLWSGRGRVPRPSATLFRAALTYWRPAAIVAVTSETSRLGRFLIRLLGRPAFRVGRVVAWRR